MRDSRDNQSFIDGLRHAEGFVSAFDQPMPGIDRETVRKLAKGLRAMADSAQVRLNKNS